MKKRSLISLVTLTILLMSIWASAGDEALYEKDPPANAAFYRVLNASESSTIDVSVAGVKVTTVEPLNVSPYGYSESATTDFALSGKTFSAATPAGSVTTLIWDGSKVVSISEEPFSSQKKARLKLFNISDQTVKLMTADEKTEVIGDVGSNQYGFRDVNALSMPFLIKSGDASLLTTEKLSLKKGYALSLFFIKNGSATLYITSEEKR